MSISCTPKGKRRLPDWIRVKVQAGGNKEQVSQILESLSLNTVCAEARCPNLHECWQRKTATFMILGKDCTRNCRFCAVDHNEQPAAPDPEEPAHVTEASQKMGLKYVVITSVTRDDLEDEGAGQFAETIRLLKAMNPKIGIEILTPDFNSRDEILEIVFREQPTVFNHNIETVRRLSTEIRTRATYDRSLEVLQKAANWPGRKFKVKSGMMVGAGETDEEVEQTIRDLRAHGVEILTIGQYLPPSNSHWPLDRYVEPEIFKRWKELALDLGFFSVASDPLVRSSYTADVLAGE